MKRESKDENKKRRQGLEKVKEEENKR